MHSLWSCVQITSRIRKKKLQHLLSVKFLFILIDFRKWFMVSFLMCVLWLAILTFTMVTLVSRTGCIIGIDHYVMGLVVIAIGTSVPVRPFMLSMILTEHECHETCHPVTFYFMKKDSKRCCDTTTPESIHTKDESKRGSAFAFIFGVN